MAPREREEGSERRVEKTLIGNQTLRSTLLNAAKWMSLIVIKMLFIHGASYRVVASPVLELLQPLDKLERVDAVALEAGLLEDAEAVLEPLPQHGPPRRRVHALVGGQRALGQLQPPPACPALPELSRHRPRPEEGVAGRVPRGHEDVPPGRPRPPRLGHRPR